jgi:hypothetical protein
VVDYFCTSTASKLSSKEAQGVSTEPEEWDMAHPRVVEALTRVRLSELQQLQQQHLQQLQQRRPASAAGRLLPLPDEAGERYRYAAFDADVC